MARPKKNTIELRLIEDCTAALSNLLVARTELDALTGRLNLIVARMQKRYEERIDAAKSRVADLETALEAYYYAHIPEIEAKGNKYLQLSTGRIGRRDNPEKLAPLNRSWTWEKVRIAVAAKFGLARFFHPAEEQKLNKEELKTLDAEQLKAIGLKKEQDETFYAEPAVLPDPSEAA